MAFSESPGTSAALDNPSGTELLRRLTGSIAHTLNNRLTGVIGCLELLCQEISATSPLRPQLQFGLTCAWQASELVRRLVMFAYRPGTVPNTSLVVLGEVAENAARRLREQNLAGVDIAVVHDATTPARANPVLVELALDQLIDNAIEAMPDGGRLTLRYHAEGSEICLSVIDTGPGLADYAAAHLFEPFVTTRSSGHLGVGLVLSRDLIEAQGGRLRLTWEVNRGTTATLSFPAFDGSGTGRAPVPSAQSDAAQPPAASLWHVI